MPENIAEIHQQVFDLLMAHHKKDPDFLFTLRKINRKGRLDKGYWFLGDDYYLTVSFWRGRDWMTKMPMISFTIKLSGAAYLEINVKSLSGRSEFFRSDFIRQLGAEPMGYDYGFVKGYGQFKNEEYLQVLEHFIQTDKKLIDRAVIEERVFWPDALQYADPIEMLWPGDFAKELKTIQRYQKQLAEKERKSGYLKYINVDEFGPIHHLALNDIPDDCRWIFLTGENGAGKTSLLKAIATGLCDNMDEGEPILPGSWPFVIRFGLTRPNTIGHHTVSGRDHAAVKKWFPKGLAMYGPVRLFTAGSLDNRFFKTESAEMRKASFGLFHSFGVLKDLSLPIVINERPKYQKDIMELLIDSLVENLGHILPNIHEITADLTDGEVILTYYQAKPTGEKLLNGVPFELLPSGTRNIAAIILDLLIRFREQQPAVTDLGEYTGIVLIDEIDLHLHPKLQKELVIQLSDTFPNIQFIVTTHSPIPLLGAPKNAVFITVYKDEEQQICAERFSVDITNLLPNTILSSPIFGFDAISSVNHDTKDRLVTEDDYSEAIFYKILAQKIKDRRLRRDAE
jgi:energy-coupling factor transporter ATP-binding protein EcfA2